MIKNKWKVINSQAGQTLLEVIIALVAGTAVIGAIVLLVVMSLSNERFGTSQNQATHYAQEGLDIFREKAQANWQNFINTYTGTSALTWCLPEDGITITQQVLPAGCGQNVQGLVRQIIVERNICPAPTLSGGIIGNVRLTSIVKWTDGKCTGTGDAKYCHSTQLVTCVFK